MRNRAIFGRYYASCRRLVLTLQIQVLAHAHSRLSSRGSEMVQCVIATPDMCHSSPLFGQSPPPHGGEHHSSNASATDSSWISRRIVRPHGGEIVQPMGGAAHVWVSAELRHPSGWWGFRPGTVAWTPLPSFLRSNPCSDQKIARFRDHLSE